MFSILWRNPQKYHFLIYCLSFTVYGTLMNAIGPLIPYLAQNQKVEETQYAFLFSLRAIAFLVGAILVKITEKHMKFHQILLAASFFSFVAYGLFSMSNSMRTQGLWFFVGSICCGIIEIVLTVSNLVAHRDHGQNQEIFVQMGHGMFGVGGLISPLFVVYFEETTYLVLGLLMLMTVPAFCMLETPQRQYSQTGRQVLDAGNLVDQIKRISVRISRQNGDRLLEQASHVNKRKESILRLVTFMFFIYIGQYIAFAGWIPSYAVMTKVSSKQQAAIYSSIFWVLMTLFRFLIAFLKMKPSKKLQILITLQIIVSLIAVVSVQFFGAHQFAACLTSVMYGTAFSGMFGLLYVMLSEYGMEVTCKQLSTFSMYGELGQGAISMVVGYLMSWISPSMLFYSILLCGLGLYLAYKKAISLLKINQMNPQIQMKELQIKDWEVTQQTISGPNVGQNNQQEDRQQ